MASSSTITLKKMARVLRHVCHCLLRKRPARRISECNVDTVKIDSGRTLAMPRIICAMATLLSYRGYKTTQKALQKVHKMPITTQAVSPLTPYMVCAKKRGSGIMTR